MDKYTTKNLTELLNKEEDIELKNKILFNWIKGEVISLQEYNELVKLILHDVSQRSELLYKQTNWLMANTSLEVEKIVDFKDHFVQ
jgi:hypothetical protein